MPPEDPEPLDPDDPPAVEPEVEPPDGEPPGTTVVPPGVVTGVPPGMVPVGFGALPPAAGCEYAQTTPAPTAATAASESAISRLRLVDCFIRRLR